MTPPHRTASVVALLLVILAGGCVAAPGADGATPADGSETADGPIADYEVYVFDHGEIGDPVVEGGIGFPVGGDAGGSNYVALIATAGETERLRVREVDEGAAAFVADTSFDGSYLVVFQAFPASSRPDYRVERVERRGDEVRLFVDDSSAGGTSDVTVETVLVRIRGDPPARAVVTAEDGRSFSSADGAAARIA